MAGLRLYLSNRLEILSDKLADTLVEAPSSPFAPEVIVVQSRGMERRNWLNKRGKMLNLAWVIFPAPWGVQCFLRYPAACGGVVH